MKKRFLLSSAAPSIRYGRSGPNDSAVSQSIYMGHAWWRRTSCRVVVLMSLLLCSSAFGQKTTGIIRGLVTDNTGAAVVGATVTITNTATGEVRTVTSNEAGEFVAPELEAGVYDVRTKQANFKEFVG